MSNTTDNYIKGLEFLRNDLITWTGTSGNFEKTEEIVKATLKLIGELQNAIKLNPRNLVMELQTKLDDQLLHNLMEKEEDKRKFKEYIDMLDSLSNDPNI